MVHNDQFYTKDNVAIDCYNQLKLLVNMKQFNVILEPSAGKGSFFKLLPKDKRIGIDIDPKHDEIKKLDFFDYKPVATNYLVIGNPPFGKISSLAIKFFNNASRFANVIAFIVPRTFKRVSVQNKLSLNFHLIYSNDLPVGSCFEPKMYSKCCFQIWEKKHSIRIKIVYPLTHKDFTFLNPSKVDKKFTAPTGADYVIRAYGSKCGNIAEVENTGENNNAKVKNPKAWHWIKVNIENVSFHEFKKRIQQLDFSISKDSVRQDSLGKAELIHIYSAKFG